MSRRRFCIGFFFIDFDFIFSPFKRTVLENLYFEQDCQMIFWNCLRNNSPKILGFGKKSLNLSNTKMKNYFKWLYKMYFWKIFLIYGGLNLKRYPIKCFIQSYLAVVDLGAVPNLFSTHQKYVNKIFLSFVDKLKTTYDLKSQK